MLKGSSGLLKYAKLLPSCMQARSAGLLELSIRPSLLSAAQEGKAAMAGKPSMPILEPGQAITG